MLTGPHSSRGMAFAIAAALLFAHSEFACAGDAAEFEKLKQGLQNPQVSLRVDAIKRAKFADGDALKAAEILGPLLGDKNPQMQQAVLAVLVKFGPDVAPVLKRQLKDPNNDLRLATGMLLLRFADKNKDLALDVLPLLADSDAKIRQTIATQFGPLQVPQSLAPLAALLCDPQNEVRGAASQSLRQIARSGKPPEPEPVHAAIRNAMPNTNNPAARTLIIHTLNDLGPTAKEHVADQRSFLIGLLKIESDHKLWPVVTSQLRRLEVKDELLHPDITPALTSHLQSPDLAVRIAVCNMLQGYGPRAANAAPALVAMLIDEDSNFRQTVSNALLSMGPSVGPVLKDELDHPLKEMRLTTALLLGQLAARHKDVIGRNESIASLVAFLKDEDPITRQAVVNVLGPMHALDAIEPLADLLRDPQPPVRLAVSRALRQISQIARPSSSTRVQAAVIHEIGRTKEPQFRNEMVITMDETGPASKETRAALIQLMTDPQPELRGLAARVLLKNVPNGPDSKEIIRPLVAALNDSEWRTRRIASLGLAKLGADGIEGLTSVVRGCPEPVARAEAVFGLGSLGPNAKVAVKALLEAAHDPSLHVRLRALAALDEIDPALCANIDLLDDDDSGVRVSALNRLKRDNAKAANDLLIKMLRHRDDDVRTAAARALSKIGPMVAADVEPFLRDANIDVRRAAIHAIEPHASPIALSGLLGDERSDIGDLAAAALAKRGASAFPALADSLKSENFRVRRDAAKAIAQSVDRPDQLLSALVDAYLAKDPEEAIAQALLRINGIGGARELARKTPAATLLKHLQNDGEDVQILACLALGEQGKADDDVIAGLTEILKNPDASVGSIAAAARTLQSFDQKGAATISPDLVARLIKDSRAHSKRLRQQLMADLPPSWKNDSFDALIAALVVGDFTETSNEWLIHHANANVPGEILAGPDLIRVLRLFHNGNSRFPRRLTPAAERALKDYFWRYMTESVPGSGPGLQPLPLADAKNPLPIERFTWLTSAYLALEMLKDDPAYKHRTIRGRPLAPLYAEWTEWWCEWTKLRPTLGLWSEMGQPAQRYQLWPCLLNMYDFAADPVLKKRIAMLLDLTFIEEEEFSLAGTRAGLRGKTTGPGAGVDQWKDLLYGDTPRRLGEECGGHSGIVWTTDYEMPTAAILLRKLGRPTRAYSIANSSTTNGVAQAYVTPHYILATHVLPNDFQGNWYRLVLDDMTAIQFPLTPGAHRPMHAQYQNATMTRLTSNEERADRIDFSVRLTTAERNGWFFASNGPAYVAIHIVGGYEIEKSDREESLAQRFDALAPKTPQANVVMQAGDARSFGSFAKFQEAILQAPLKTQPDRITYTGPGLPPLEFFARHDKNLLVSGAPQKIRSDNATFESPYLQGTLGSPQITVRVGDIYSAIYDFEKNAVTEMKTGS